MSRRIGCLHVPQLPLQALLRAEPDRIGEPVAITEGEGSRRSVVACTRQATEGGITPGMTAAGARGLLPGIVLRPSSTAQVRSAQAALTDAARSFSPRVVVEPGGEVCLDLAGLSHLFPSEQKLGSALLVRARGAGLDVRAGIASTRLCALLAARISGGLEVIPAGEERAFLAPLPVSLLEASADLNATLRRFGVERLGQLADLPSRGLGRRLGSAGLSLWRQARGEDPTPLVADPAPERFVEATDCAYPLGQIEPLLASMRSVFKRLSDRLRLRGMTARALFVACGLDPTGADERTLALASPTPEVRTWLTVARLALEERPPRAPVISVRVEAQVSPSRLSQLDLFASAGPPPARLDDTLARLAALSGEGRVGSPRPVDSHRPGAYALVPFGTRSRASAGGHEGAPTGTANYAARPARVIASRVVRPPAEVAVRTADHRPARLRGRRFRGKVLQCAGPWRLDGGWWEDALDRDYYEVELSDGGVYRVYRDRKTERWFVDGICG